MKKREREQELTALRDVMAPLKNDVKRPYTLSGEVLRARLEAAEDAKILTRRMPRWVTPLASALCVLAVAFGSAGVWIANFRGGFSSGAAVNHAAALSSEEYAMDDAAADMAPVPEEAPAAAGGMMDSTVPEAGMDGGAWGERGALLKSVQNPETAGAAEDTDTAPPAAPTEMEDAEEDSEDVFADWSVEPAGGNGPVVSDGMLYYTDAPDGAAVLYAAKADASGPVMETALPEGVWPQGLYAAGERVAVTAQVYGEPEEGMSCAAAYVYRVTENALELEHTFYQEGDLAAACLSGGTLTIYTVGGEEVRCRLDGDALASRPMDTPYASGGPSLAVGRLALDGEAEVQVLAGGASQLYIAGQNAYAGYVRDGETEIVRIRPDGRAETVGTVPVEVEWSSCYHERDGILYVTPRQGGLFVFGAESYNREPEKAN